MPWALALAAAWSASPISVTPPSFAAAKEPQVAIEGESVYIAYGMGDAVFLSRSRDSGESYEAPVKVAESGKLSLGMRRGPRVAVKGGVLTVTATYGAQGGGRDGDVLSFRSADGGTSWSGPVKVNDASGSAREGLHGMAIASDGTLACAWLDLRDKGTRLYMSISRDGGASWSVNRQVYASPSGTICECCHPSLAFDASGRLYLMFRNSLEGNRDMYLTDTRDGGQTFSAARKLGEGSWPLNACPMDGGMLAAGPDGSIFTVWRRDKSVFSSGDSGPETLVSLGRQPWMSWSAGGSASVWLQGSEVWAKVGTGDSGRLSLRGDSPTISSAGGLTVAAWTEDGIKATRLQGITGLGNP